MIKNKFFRRLVLLVSSIILLTYTVNTTFGYIITETDSIVNTFVSANPHPSDISVDITVNKTVKNTGVSSISPAGFEFVLENTANGEKLVLESNEDGKAIFTLPFTEEDVGKIYTYKLSETDNGIEGVVYDTDVYDVSVAVALGEDNELIATVTKNGEAVDAVVAEFENVYHTEEPVSPPTGEDNNVTFWLIMLIVSGMVCVALALFDKRYAKARR